MPIILDPASYCTWLDTSITGADAKAILVGRQIDDQLEFFRVSCEVNSSCYRGEDTKKPIVNPL